jgi:RNA polymerase sigma factor (sigma-70 family)
VEPRAGALRFWYRRPDFDLLPVWRCARRTLGCDPSELDDLVARARDGEEAAWEALVRGTSNAVYRGLAAFDVPREVRDELYHETYVKLFEQIDSIQRPGGLPKWLMTTARNQALHYLKESRRMVPVADAAEQPNYEALDETLLDSELKVAVARAFRRLSDACQTLLRLLTVTPALSYGEIAELLGRPVGDIGPQRMRCLKKLRLAPDLIPFLDVLPE